MRYVFLLLIILLITIRYYLSLPSFRDGDTIRITTQVLTEPIVFGDKQYFKIYGLKIYLPRYPEISYGDRVEITGVISNSKLQILNYKF